MLLLMPPQVVAPDTKVCLLLSRAGIGKPLWLLEQVLLSRGFAVLVNLDTTVTVDNCDCCHLRLSSQGVPATNKQVVMNGLGIICWASCGQIVIIGFGVIYGKIWTDPCLGPIGYSTGQVQGLCTAELSRVYTVEVAHSKCCTSLHTLVY